MNLVKVQFEIPFLERFMKMQDFIFLLFVLNLC